jgi:beta-fructofuranosidase
MLVGAGHTDGHAAVLSFTSDDLDTWRYRGPLARRPAHELDPGWSATAWECPHLVSVDGHDLLVVSVWAHDVTRYVAVGVGRYADGRMAVDRWTRLTSGTGHYAATTFTDAAGEPCVMFWIREVAAPDGAWTGAISLPYRLRVADGQPVLAPHPGVRATGGVDPQRTIGLDWTVPAGGRLDLRTADGEPVARLSAAGGLLDVGTRDGRATAPLGDGPAHVVLDGGVLEVCTGRALIGLAVPPHGPLAPPGGDAGVVPWWPQPA